jgi:uncharacterized protein YndB with AHSA1/START domain
MNKKMHFSIRIDAPRKKVWNVMLSPETYKQWTAAFMPGSYYEGSWDAGERIVFGSPDGNGMLAEIAENRPHEYVSIKHVGELRNGVEDTTSESVRRWAPAFENYTFSDAGSSTDVRVEMDVTPEYEEYMARTWPVALARLKEICEGGS